MLQRTILSPRWSRAAPGALERFADFRALGRVVVREGGQTLAVGIVTELLQ